MPNVSEVNSLTPVTPANQNQKALPRNVLILAYLYLIEAENTTSQAALIKTKELSNNAEAQNALIAEEAKLHWHELPHEIVHKHVVRVKGSMYWSWTLGGEPIKYHYHKHVVYTYPNLNKVDQAQAFNEEQMAIRQRLSNQMAVLEQRSKIGMSQTQVIADDAVQYIQEGSKILSMIETLTYKALLRQPAHV